MKRCRYWYVVYTEDKILLEGRILHEQAWKALTEDGKKEKRVVANMFHNESDYKSFKHISRKETGDD